ncbi:Di-copper centre-containing protein [Sistotremastrum suecicum HHB10207 ss-3]|uniref:tyrosinase n=1 Tax=Sistotremastrum suecicum HHB10207 ss-3 TaxID=1314776 RepID=A0A166DZM7_9AGAM|nr:Di-copper centre-containing protein [Sistotremastrum suecicum HHB10207 ss-3]
MAPQTFAITGIKAGWGPLPGQIPLRQEIDSWAANPDNAFQVDLFLQALAIFQQMPAEEKTSYIKVASIHGLTSDPWDEEEKTENPDAKLGYCTHNNQLFPTWHRPYLILFEQLIHQIMITQVIPPYPSPSHRAKLEAEAKAWRLPYWDWAAKKIDPNDPDAPPNYNVPEILRQPEWTVSTPSGVSKKIPNPLYAFITSESMGTFGIPDVEDSPFSISHSTSRHPPKYSDSTASVWVNGYQDNDKIRDGLRGADWFPTNDPSPPWQQDSLGEAVYRLFSEGYFSSYDAFATTGYHAPQKATEYLSLEGIHNNIHIWCGGGNPPEDVLPDRPIPEPVDGAGHMSRPETSALDPILYLHHCNVDRLFAIWQTLNPDAWFRKQHLIIAGQEPVTSRTPLAPFHTDTKGTYFSSDLARDWTQYGYTYPELQHWLPKYIVDGKLNRELYVQDVTDQITSLYQPTYILSRPSFATGTSSEENDYVVNVEYERFALGGEPFTVHIYIGKTKVGQVYNFSSSLRSINGSIACANCQEQQLSGAISTGQVPITAPLLHIAKQSPACLSTLERDHVKKFLLEDGSLSWKVTKLSGEVVPLKDIPSLKVSVAGGKALHHAHPLRETTEGDARKARLSSFHSHVAL